MAAKAIDISLLGDRELQRRFNALDNNTARKILRPALRDAAKLAQRSAQAKAPVDTGKMRQNIKVRAVPRRRGQIGAMIRTGTRKEMGIPENSRWYYPAIVEFGTKDRAARPFMRPALEENRDRMMRRIARRLWAGVRSLARQ